MHIRQKSEKASPIEGDCVQSSNLSGSTTKRVRKGSFSFKLALPRMTSTVLITNLASDVPTCTSVKKQRRPAPSRGTAYRVRISLGPLQKESVRALFLFKPALLRMTSVILLPICRMRTFNTLSLQPRARQLCPLLPLSVYN